MESYPSWFWNAHVLLDTDCDLLLERNVKKLIFVAASVALLIVGIGAGTVLVYRQTRSALRP